MEIAEFREKLHSYHGSIDSSTFINAFLDASHKYEDNLELILQEMEKAKEEYKSRIELYAKKLSRQN